MLTTICNNVNPLTLLSPARDIATAKAAIQAGADAIYIGAERFGARHAAGNSLDDIASLVRYARPYGVKVLVTLNTLLTDEERPEAVALAWNLYRIGVDALIIQDLSLLSENLPPIRLHASTQCDNRTPEHVKHLRDLGFARVVLARELTLDEIRAIHEAVPDIELEAFVHGALCVSYSGRCYMSEVLLGRSANRGCCAQMCRMRYDVLDEQMNPVLDDDGQPILQRYVLSLQDLDRSMYLSELIDAGVTTFKIEGRLKDADYVTNITAYYRDAIDTITNHPSTHQPINSSTKGAVYSRTFTPDPKKTFHRGATDYFLHGRTAPMANWLTPKSTGEPIGEVLEVRGNALRVRLLPGITLHNGDGLTLGSEGFNVNGIDGDWIKTNKPINLSTYKLINRNVNVSFLRSLHSERRVPVDILLEETEVGFRLTIGDRTADFTADKQLADNPERAMDTIRRQLAKLGDTIYTARTIDLRLSQPYFIPISLLNEWRRQLTRES